MSLPYDFGQARKAVRDASHRQERAEDFMREAAVSTAKAEEAYRLALAQQITRVHAEGAAWTVAQDLARGDAHVASLRRERDIAEGVKEAAQQAMWRHAADRRELELLIDWSMRVSLDGQPREPLARAA